MHRLIFPLLLFALLLIPAAPTRAAATIAVTTTADEFDAAGAGAGCSLREAIRATNSDAAFGGCPAGSGADTITLGATTYTLSRAGANENANATGDLDITGELTITGADVRSTTINGAGIDRVIDTGAGVSVKLARLAVAGGKGGIFNGGALMLDSVQVIDSAGDGIANAANTTLTMLASSVARSSGSGVVNAGADAVLTLNDSVVANNTGDGIGLGTGNRLRMKGGSVDRNASGIVAARGALVALDGVLLARNRANGLQTGTNGTATLTNTQAISNTGTGIVVEKDYNLRMRGGAASGNGAGGVLNKGGSATLQDAIVAGNITSGVSNFGLMVVTGARITGNVNSLYPYGGGAYNDYGATMIIDHTLIDGNRIDRDVGGGAGIANFGTLSVNASTVSNNTGRNGATTFGGGLFSFAPTGDFAANATVTNSTISGNAASAGGGVYAKAGPAPAQASVFLRHATLAGNRASGPGANIAVAQDGDLSAARGVARLVNTIVAGEPGKNCEAPAGAAFIESLGHNLETGSTCGLAADGDKPNADPLLGSLQLNGGLTPTHALAARSPARAAASADACPSTDQRDVPRRASSCDIGAYQFAGLGVYLPIVVR